MIKSQVSTELATVTLIICANGWDSGFNPECGSAATSAGIMTAWSMATQWVVRLHRCHWMAGVVSQADSTEIDYRSESVTRFTLGNFTIDWMT